MGIEPWETLSEERLLKFKVFDVRKVRRRSPRNGEEVGFFVIDTWDWVDVVAFTDAGELIMIEQFRQGPSAVTLEIPGGVCNPGEDPGDTAIRELREETGYLAKDVLQIGAVNPNPAIFTNTCTTFLASNCELDGELQQDPGEDIRVVLVPWETVEERVRAGEIDHSLVLSALYFYRLHVEAMG